MKAVAVKIPRSIDNDTFNALLGKVSPERVRRTLELRMEADKIRGIMGELLARRLIMEKTDMQNQQIEFTTNPEGKPFLKNRDDIHFNISHSGGWVTAAIDDRPVGMDVEQLDPLADQIPEIFFSKREQQYVKYHPHPLTCIFTIWTLKESYIKYLGKGLFIPIQSVSVEFRPDRRITMKQEEQPVEGLYFKRYDISPRYECALCSEHENVPDTLSFIDADTVIKTFI